MPLANAAVKKGIHVHYLNIGQPDILSPQAFWDGVDAFQRTTLAYSPSPGRDDIREAALADYRSRGIPVEPEELVVTAGGSEAMLFAFLACFDPGDEVLVLEPYYANYKSMAGEAGVNLISLMTKIEEDFALPTVEEIEARLTPKTKGILLCNPSNPTGCTFSNAHLHGIAKIAINRDLFLIVDEVYRDFNYTDSAIESCLSVKGLEQHAVMIDSLSKRLSLCGARIGFFASHNKGIMESAVKLSQARLSIGTLDQAGAARALSGTPPEYMAKIRAEYMHRRDVLVAGLKRMEGVICPRIDGAFYAFVQLPVDDAEEFCKWMLSDFEYRNETVLMAPGEGFYLTPGVGKNQARIAYVLEAAQLERALDCIRVGLENYPGRLAPAAQTIGIS